MVFLGGVYLPSSSVVFLGEGRGAFPNPPPPLDAIRQLPRRHSKIFKKKGRAIEPWNHNGIPMKILNKQGRQIISPGHCQKNIPER